MSSRPDKLQEINGLKEIKKTRISPVDKGTKRELCSSSVHGEDIMFRAVVQEAAALASLALFIGMIAIWAQVLTTL